MCYNKDNERRDKNEPQDKENRGKKKTQGSDFRGLRSKSRRHEKGQTEKGRAQTQKGVSALLIAPGRIRRFAQNPCRIFVHFDY